MGITPDTSPYGSQTLMGPAWPNIEEEELAAAAESFEALAIQLTGTVVPQLQGQRVALQGDWTGAGSDAAMGEASTIINGHEINAAEASAIAQQLHLMEAVVAKTKAAVNMTAEETQQQCEALQSSGSPGSQAAVQAQVAMGLAQNMSTVTAGTAELGEGLGVPASASLGQSAAALGDPQQMQQVMQMAMQMVSQVGQVPQQLGKMAGQGMQQLTQPLQQLTSMFGKMGSGGQGAKSFSPFSNHPMAGGSGASGGAGLVHAASTPGAGGSSSRTPLMANLVGNHTTGPSATAVAAGAAASEKAIGGTAPVRAGGGGMGGMGAMGARGTSGGSRAAMSVPAPLEHDLTEEDVDDDW